MVKRTVEIVLTVIGMVLFGIPLFVSTVVMGGIDDPGVREGVENFINSSEFQAQPGAEDFTSGQLLTMFESLGQFVLIASIVGLAVGILALIFLIGNKKPKAAGIMLIVSAIVLTLATLFLGIFGGAAYLVAGIVALVRKSRKPLDGTVT
ncbi:DUF4064 domain-containing protein [Halobacillus sp. ACCC02827]|uniref:DUF4064 domain-containing protein n=1 Tax=Halobacillus sp. ACCC02827 TaxID=3052090 RepID=UPI00257002B3|nr:DUF4064 domain-containing protein [Halobacillus sp. ACCC02827]WJE16063.1 DUF4064 domain-containing protein [Halobacillus sp. ACCC02827]